MSSSESEIEGPSHAASLKKLQTTDPEFYQFLKENDETLLEYEDSPDEENESNCVEPQDEEEIDELLPTHIEQLKEELQNKPTFLVCKKLMSSLKSCINSRDDQLSIVNGNVFNEVMKLCLIELVPALSKALRLPKVEGHSLDPSKSKLWKRASTAIKSYLIDILKIVSVMNEPITLALILKHIMRLVPYYVQFMKLARLLVKRMITAWSTSTEKARVIAFMVIFRVVEYLPEEYHSQILKQLYFAFVRNSKFSTLTSLPLIAFMKRSLTEMYTSHPEIAYEHAFLYLRQLCIHLRNAITTKKKEAVQTVYNWQYVHCIMLWSDVICALYDSEPIKTLLYPLIQLTTGTINLIPTTKYIPLRFHLVKTLIKVSSLTKAFIPTVPFILEALTLVDSNKKMTFGKKAINLDCALKASKSELQESGYRDTVVTEVCNLLMEYFEIYAATISFPELTFLAIQQLKAYLKKNKIAKYGQQIKLVTEKLQQNSEFILQRRSSVSFQITDVEEVEKWERTLQGTAPLSKQVVKVPKCKTGPAIENTILPLMKKQRTK